MKYRIKPSDHAPLLLVQRQSNGQHNWDTLASFPTREECRQFIDKEIAHAKEMEEFRNANPIEYYP